MSNARRVFINAILKGPRLSLANLDLNAYAQERKKKQILGIIAVSLPGQTHLGQMLKRHDVKVIAEPDKKMLVAAKTFVLKYKRKAPKEFGNGPNELARYAMR